MIGCNHRIVKINNRIKERHFQAIYWDKNKTLQLCSRLSPCPKCHIMDRRARGVFDFQLFTFDL